MVLAQYLSGVSVSFQHLAPPPTTYVGSWALVVSTIDFQILFQFLHIPSRGLGSSHQILTRLWHRLRHCKVSTLIWLTINHSIPVASWLEKMSNSSIRLVYHSDIVETPQHCLTSAPRLNPLGKLSLKFGTNRRLIRTSLSPAPLFCLVKLSLRVKRMILSLIKCTMGAFLTLDSH